MQAKLLPLLPSSEIYVEPFVDRIERSGLVLIRPGHTYYELMSEFGFGLGDALALCDDRECDHGMYLHLLEESVLGEIGE